MSMPFTPGTVLAGKYRIERLLGEGGMGWVVLATHLQLEQHVALKFMHATYAAERPDAVKRFLREARAAARIRSEHVARVSDVGTLENGAPYLVMEYLEGQDLDALLHDRGTIPVAQTIDYVLQACEGLAEAHAAGVIHRDLKPANLFLARRSDGSVRVKLLDFGISKLTPASGGAPDAGMTSTQALMGSPLYMSPEQLRSSKNVDGRSDIWSIGVILYELLSGRSPFEAETLPEVCARVMAEPAPPLTSHKPDLPPALDAVVTRCLEKDPLRRLPDVASLAKALAPFGAPEGRAIAERIARLARASTPSLGELPADTTGSSPTVLARPGVAQTNASFSTVKPATPRRSSTVKIVAACGALLAGVAIVGGVMSTRSRPAELPLAPAQPSPGTAAPLVPDTNATATAPPSATAIETAMATATLTPTVTAPVAAASTPPAGTAGTRAPPPRTRPTATAPATTATKPASTAGFGGRN
jgi:serine/threonine-protein kinase